ncbi:hypothetical protein [Flavobacterium sp.]|uniref:hypothetical protein n=1 Tax=Flavobacterium sp. TaxID=239 RepID=UPI002BA87DB1|nr:hypothetical protein [Flavobacterium sp.]HSD08048.1 hypothetical protein [Flavobacterium sp.]
MKLINIISVSLFLSCYVTFGQNENKTDLAKENLKGNVKSVKSNSFEPDIKFDKVVKGMKIPWDWANTYSSYDKKGNKIKPSKSNIKKNSENNNSEEDMLTPPPSPTLSDKGKKYDDYGKLIEYCEYKSDGSLSYKVIYNYDDNNNEIESTSYNSNGSLIEKQTSKYELDKNGNWIIRVVFRNQNAYYITERQILYYK